MAVQVAARGGYPLGSRGFEDLRKCMLVAAIGVFPQSVGRRANCAPKQWAHCARLTNARRAVRHAGPTRNVAGYG
jgi:hypothetical protein